MKSTVFHHSAHMSEGELLELSVSCPFCTSTKRTPILVLQEDPRVALLLCHACHAASASRMPTGEALGKYYSRYYDAKKVKITVDAPSRIASHIVQHARPSMGGLNGRSVSLLDYGGGDGSISTRVAQELLDQGAEKVNIFLIDYDRSLPEIAGQRLQIFRPADLAQLADGSIDLVIASAVIEHIPEPRNILTKLFSSLKPDGVFYARTPYVAPLSRIADVVNLKLDFTYPAHLHDLGAKFWGNIVNILSLDGEYQVLRSTPSIVETSFKQHFMRTLTAHILKMPGYIFKETYGLVGGWEVFFHRHS